MAAQKDEYAGTSKAINAPASRWAAVTLHDSNPLGYLPKGIHNAGTAGTVAVVGADDVAATFYMVQGATLMIRPKIIKSTGTSAGAIVALY